MVLSRYNAQEQNNLVKMNGVDTHRVRTCGLSLGDINNLKIVDTIGNCQRPVFSLGASQHMHKITNL